MWDQPVLHLRLSFNVALTRVKLLTSFCQEIGMGFDTCLGPTALTHETCPFTDPGKTQPETEAALKSWFFLNSESDSRLADLI